MSSHRLEMNLAQTRTNRKEDSSKLEAKGFALSELTESPASLWNKAKAKLHAIHPRGAH